MKAIFLFVFFATQWAYAKPFVPLTETQEAELRHVIGVIQAAANETAVQLEAARADNENLRAKASDSIFQLNAATNALVKAGDETVRVQGIVNTRTQERDAALADAAVQRKWKWRWCVAFFGLSAAVAIYIFLKLKSIVP